MWNHDQEKPVALHLVHKSSNKIYDYNQELVYRNSSLGVGIKKNLTPLVGKKSSHVFARFPGGSD